MAPSLTQHRMRAGDTERMSSDTTTSVSALFYTSQLQRWEIDEANRGLEHFVSCLSVLQSQLLFKGESDVFFTRSI